MLRVTRGYAADRRSNTFGLNGQMTLFNGASIKNGILQSETSYEVSKLRFTKNER